MKVNVLVRTEVNLKPGDSVILDINWSAEYQRMVRVKRLVETKHGVYVVFDNNTWRPMSTNGLTWKRVGD